MELLISEFFKTKSKSRCFPLPTNALVVSHPMKACNPRSISVTSLPSVRPMTVTFIQSLRCFVPVMNNTFDGIFGDSALSNAATSVSGDFIS